MRNFSKAVGFVLGVVCAGISAAAPLHTSASPDGKSAVEWTCTDEFEQACDIRARSGGKVESVWKGVRAPTVTWPASDLAEIRVGCGSPCFYSKFYSPRYGVSPDIEFVLAVAPRRLLAVSAGAEHLEVVPIFQKGQKPVQRIRLDFSPTAAAILAVEEVKLLDDSTILIRYLSGPNYEETEAKIVLSQ